MLSSPGRTNRSALSPAGAIRWLTDWGRWHRGMEPPHPCHCARSASWQVPSAGSWTGVGASWARLPPHPRHCEGAPRPWQSSGTRARGRLRSRGNLPRPSQRHFSERFLHSLRSVEMTEGSGRSSVMSMRSVPKARAVETSLSLCLRQKTATALRASQRRRGRKTATGLAVPSLRSLCLQAGAIGWHKNLCSQRSVVLDQEEGPRCEQAVGCELKADSCSSRPCLISG